MYILSHHFSSMIIFINTFYFLDLKTIYITKIIIKKNTNVKKMIKLKNVKLFTVV